MKIEWDYPDWGAFWHTIVLLGCMLIGWYADFFLSSYLIVSAFIIAREIDQHGESNPFRFLTIGCRSFWDWTIPVFIGGLVYLGFTYFV